jgi:hypothetical protein
MVRPDTHASATRNAILEEYARLAPRYERRWSFYVGATSRETLARLNLSPAGDYFGPEGGAVPLQPQGIGRPLDRPRKRRCPKG